MTPYSSREPFDVWVSEVTGQRYASPPKYGHGRYFVEKQPQNNPTNPILTEFRRLVNETGNGLYVTAWLFSGDLLEEWESYPLEQWHHAMDVLQKILSVYKKEES